MVFWKSWWCCWLRWRSSRTWGRSSFLDGLAHKVHKNFSRFSWIERACIALSMEFGSELSLMLRAFSTFSTLPTVSYTATSLSNLHVSQSNGKREGAADLMLTVRVSVGMLGLWPCMRSVQIVKNRPRSSRVRRPMRSYFNEKVCEFVTDKLRRSFTMRPATLRAV